jgi:hypothetical protein
MIRLGACAKCGQQKLCDPYGNPIDLWYNVTLPTGITVLVCSGCKVLLERRAPDALTVERLRSAETDLHEASELDPSNEQIQKNLRDLLAMFGNIGLQPKRPKKSRRGRGTRKRPEGLVKRDASGVVRDVPMFGTVEASGTERRGPAAWMLAAAVLVGLAVVGSQLDDYFYEDPSAWRSQLATSVATGAPSPPSSAPEGETASVVEVEPFAVRMPAGAQIRQGPGSEFPVIAQNGATARYEVFQETPNWRRIRLPGGNPAWVLKTDTRVLPEARR